MPNDACASGVKRSQFEPLTNRSKRSRCAVVAHGAGALHSETQGAAVSNRRLPSTVNRRYCAERQLVAITQCPSLVAAEISAQIGGAAAENGWHIDSAGNCQPGARTRLWRGHDQLFVLRHESRVAGRKILARRSGR